MSNQIFPAAARSATFIGGDNARSGLNKGCKVAMVVTAVPGVDTVQLVIEGRDPASATYYTMLQAAARVAAGTDILTMYPGETNTANVSVNDQIPDVYRVRVVHSGAGVFTYSVSVSELP
jgi:hypothetical protein